MHFAYMLNPHQAGRQVIFQWENWREAFVLQLEEVVAAGNYFKVLSNIALGHFWVLAASLLSHVFIGICSFVAPRQNSKLPPIRYPLIFQPAA